MPKMIKLSKDNAASVANAKNDPATWEIKDIVLEGRGGKQSRTAQAPRKSSSESR